MGFLTEDDAPIIWRGPMLHGALQQFFREVRWVDLDYLIVDMPPGTGDVALSLSQTRAGRRRDRRHHAAAGVARRQPARGGDVQEAQHPDARHHREHELLRLSRTASTKPTSSATAAASGWPRSWACRSSAACRSTSRSARAATAGVPLIISEPDSPAARAFMAAAERTAAQVSIASYTRPTIPLDAWCDEHSLSSSTRSRTASTCSCTRITPARSWR